MTTAKEILVQAGLDNSHWGQRILIAEQCGHFTDTDEDEASFWITCACGKLEKSLMGKPNAHNGDPGPYDKKLRRLGETFEDLVRFNNIGKAATQLVLIEKRATKLLRDNK